MTLDDGLKVLAALTPIVLGVLTYYTATAKTNAERAARNAEVAVKKVETALASTSDVTTEKLDTIHTLVNSRLTEALKKIDRLEARLYKATGETPTGEPPRAT